MIIESGTPLEFKRCLITTLPWVPHENEMWKLKTKGSAVAVIVRITGSEEVIMRVAQQKFLQRMTMKEFFEAQEKGRIALIDQRAVSSWELM